MPSSSRTRSAASRDKVSRDSDLKNEKEKEKEKEKEAVPLSATSQSPQESHLSIIQTPTLPTTQTNPALSARSSTSPDRHPSPHVSASFSTRLRARTITQSKQPPLHLNLPSTAIESSRPPSTLPPLAESPSEKPSAPIDIPVRKPAAGQVSRPTTPLTARAPQGEYFTSWYRIEPRISQSLTPYYSSHAKKTSDDRDPAPLSLKMSVPLSSINSGQKAKAPVQSLNLAGLPKYHPANFPSRDSSAAPPSTRTSRSITSQPRSGPGSDAKHQLLQYQRDLINNTAKTSRSPLSPPRLNPLRSPGGPMTPLMLESAGDYISSCLPAGLKEGDGGEFVERLIRRENETRNYAEARSGSPAVSLSPAVSPAGGRG